MNETKVEMRCDVIMQIIEIVPALSRIPKSCNPISQDHDSRHTSPYDVAGQAFPPVLLCH
jgi:hypothetical protein